MWTRGLRGALALTIVTGGLVGAAPSEPAKKVIGTVRAAGPVESATTPGEWKPFKGGAALDGMTLRTGAKGTAVVQMKSGDVVGLGEQSTLAIDGTRIRLESGRVALRLRPTSRLVVDTARGTIRQAAVQPVAASQREALVTIVDGAVTVHAYRGAFELDNPNGTATEVKPGQVATVAPDAQAPTLSLASALTTTPEAKSVDQGASAGAVGGVAGSTLAWVGVGTGIVAGGTVGGLAGSGAIGGDDDDDDEVATGGPPQVSPFRPVKR